MQRGQDLSHSNYFIISFQREGRGGFTLNIQSLMLIHPPWRSLLNVPSSLSALPFCLRAPLPKGLWKYFGCLFLLSPATLHSVQHISVTFMASTPFITSEVMASRRRLGVFVWEESGKEGLASLSSLGVTCLWLRWAQFLVAWSWETQELGRNFNKARDLEVLS